MSECAFSRTYSTEDEDGELAWEGQRCPLMRENRCRSASSEWLRAGSANVKQKRSRHCETPHICTGLARYKRVCSFFAVSSLAVFLIISHILRGRAVPISSRGRSSIQLQILQAQTCEEYGCTVYQPDQTCQCNAECSLHGNCCADFQQICETTSTTSTTTTTTTMTTLQGCALYGCVARGFIQTCDCFEGCMLQATCCSDYVALCAATTISIQQLSLDVFPGPVYDAWAKYHQTFKTIDPAIAENCLVPWPSVYFANPKMGSYPLFHNQIGNFPMATEYMDTSAWWKPSEGHFQTVIGFADLQGPYYQYLGDMVPRTPYLVISMDPFNYSPELNLKFVECGLLGWPGFPQFTPEVFSIRLVVKNPLVGRPCFGPETGHAWCNLATSWGMDPINNNWRPTSMEVNALIDLCTRKYSCQVQKATGLVPPSGKVVPQVYNIRVLRDLGGQPLPPNSTSADVRLT